MHPGGCVSDSVTAIVPGAPVAVVVKSQEEMSAFANTDASTLNAAQGRRRYRSQTKW